MDQQHEPQDQSDELPYWPIYGVDLLFELTVSEAVMSLASRIPPELFDNILFYVNVHCRTDIDLGRKRGGRTSRDMPNDLTQCSLVCLFWANRCREHIFRDITLEIRSYKDAEIFRRYVVQGCPRLTPVHQLITKIYVMQAYSKGSERQTSFLHLLNLPAIQDKLQKLSIEGPVSEGFNPAKLDTPHWGIPPCIVAPSSFLQKQVLLHHIHLPSFHHVAKYIKHFSRATEIEFLQVTWDGQMAPSLPHAPSTIFCQRRPRSLAINAWGGCTDSVHLALTAVMLNPNCPLHRLSDEERVWMMKFMTLLWGDKIDTYMYIGFNVSEQATTMRASLLHFVFEEAPATDRPDSVLSVVGMHAYIVVQSWERLPANFDALVNHARTQPTIRALVLLFDSFALLQESMKPFVEVLGPATEAIEFVCAYEEQEEIEVPRGFWRKTGRVLGVDPVTLEPTGRIWADLPDEWLSKSSEILRRKLKKKP